MEIDWPDSIIPLPHHIYTIFFPLHLNLMSMMDLLFFINSFHFIMPILLSVLLISVLETLLAKIYQIKG